MSLPVDFDLKERVRSSVDIVDVVGSQLELRPQGRQFVARCPWHEDRRPSLTVNQQRQTWKCWVCDIGGDIFSYVMRRDGVDFPGALQILAERAGIDVQSARGGRRAAPGSPEDKATLLSAMKFAADAFYDFLDQDQSTEADAARQYLAERGIDDDSRQRFRIGYAPDQWRWLLERAARAGFTAEVIEAVGLAVRKDPQRPPYDRFRGRLIFPIQDLQGRPISVGGRILPGRGDQQAGAGAKYINGPETRLFSKSQQLYGLNLARQAIQTTRQALIVEGYTDVVAVRQAGIEPVVAVLGTALGEGHIRILRRFADRVVLLLDGDTAGRKRADEVLELFVGADIDLRILTLPDGADPADFVGQFGRTALEQLIATAPDAIDHKLARLTEGVDLTHDTHRATRAVETMLALISTMPVASGDLRLQQLIVRLGRTFGLPVDDLRRRFDELRRQRRGARQLRDAGGPPTVRSGDVGRPSRRPSPSRSADPNAALLESAESELELVDRRSGPAERPAVDPQQQGGWLPPITSIDSKLFEVLIEEPDLVPLAIESVDPSCLGNDTARLLLQVYQELDLQGRPLNIESVLLAIDDERLKNQVVTMDERIQLQQGKVDSSPRERYTSQLEYYHRQDFLAQQRRRLAELEATSGAEDDILELLRQTVEDEKARRGHLPPTAAPPDVAALQGAPADPSILQTADHHPRKAPEGPPPF